MFFLLGCLAAATSIVVTEIFENGKEGYPCYRQPVVASRDNIVLAFASGRSNTYCAGSDVLPFHMVVKRSLDGGQTFKPVQTLYSGSPDYYVVAWEPSAKAWFLLVQVGQNTLIWNSTTDGASWAGPRQVTLQFAGMSAVPGVGKALLFDCSKCDCTPQERARILMPFVCKNSSGSHSCIVYSDDGLASFQLGGLGQTGTRESQLVQVPVKGGKKCGVYANERNMTPKPGHRMSARSADAGLTFTDFKVEESLPEPVTANWTGIVAGAIRYSWPSKGVNSTILYTAPLDPTSRAKLGMLLSNDEGESWVAGPILFMGPSAYSDITLMQGGGVGVIFENGDSSFVDRISLAYLKAP